MKNKVDDHNSDYLDAEKIDVRCKGIYSVKDYELFRFSSNYGCNSDIQDVIETLNVNVVG